MRIAVVADVHANALALEAVLTSIRTFSPDVTVCLGDLVGYNAEPGRSVQMVRSAAGVVVAGNHDRDMMRDAPIAGTHSDARTAQRWTRQQLDENSVNYLTTLPNRHVEPGYYTAVHGCFLNEHHYTGYVTSTMVEQNLRAVAVRPELPVVALCGHTHVPMCAYLERDGAAVELATVGEATWPASAEAVLVNPGSVGQPRDGDLHAAFAILEPEKRSARFVRVEYDVALAARRVREAGLPAGLADRLLEGR